MAEKGTAFRFPRVVANNRFISQEVGKGSLGLSRLHEMHPSKIISNLETTDRIGTEEEFSMFSNEQWGVGKADLPWQFGPSTPLDFCSEYITLEETPSMQLQEFLREPKKPDCGVSPSSQFDWQCLMEHGPAKYGSCLSMRSKDSKENPDFHLNLQRKVAEEAVIPLEEDSSSLSSELVSNTDSLSVLDSSKSSKRTGNLSTELSTSKLTSKDSTTWRTADSSELATLVSQKRHEHLENCDLPPSLGSYSRKGPLASLDSMSKSDASSSMASSVCGSDEKKYLSTHSQKMGMSDPTPLKKHQPSLSGPRAIPSSMSQPSRAQRHSLQDQNTSWSGRLASVSGRGSVEVLGEALCHSQTRAREAEKAVAQALQEKEKLSQLLFREVWTSQTYRQWIQILELENLWLKLHKKDAPDVWEEQELVNSLFTFEHASHAHAKYLRKHPPWSKLHHRPPAGKNQKHGWALRGNFLVRCTLGFAFALGLSFASAGFVIGWSMGWILLAY